MIRPKHIRKFDAVDFTIVSEVSMKRTSCTCTRSGIEVRILTCLQLFDKSTYLWDIRFLG